MNAIMTRLLATLILALLTLTAQGVKEVIYYHNDALGSPIIATDVAKGVATEGKTVLGHYPE